MKRAVLLVLVGAAAAAAVGWFVVFPAVPRPVVAVVGSPVTGGSGTSPLAGEVRAALASYVSQMRQRTGAPGVSAAVVLPGDESVTAAVGYADAEARLALTPDTLMLGGSTGKSYCAAAVMRLVAEGRLSLDDRVSRYLGRQPWFSLVPNGEALTVRMLLTHTGGLPQFLDIGAFQRSLIWDALRGSDIGYPPGKMLSFLGGQAAVNQPGAGFHYSDLGFVILGLLVEQVAGQPYFDVVRTEVLRPLGLDWIRPATARRIPGLAVGYVGSTWMTRVTRMAGRNMDGGQLRFNPAIEFSGGGLANTPLGLAAFYKGLLEGRLLDRAHTLEMVDRAVPSPSLGKTSRYGFGLIVAERPELGRYVGHSGWYPGYLSNAYWFGSHGFSVAVQVNCDEGIDIFTPVREIAARVIELTRAAGVDPARGR